MPFVPLELDIGQVGEAVAGSHGLRHVVRFWRAMGRRAAGSTLRGLESLPLYLE